MCLYMALKLDYYYSTLYIRMSKKRKLELDGFVETMNKEKLI